MVNQAVELTRDVRGVLIPGGDTILLPAGSRVYITQMYGTSIAVASDHGLVRLMSADKDALGLEEAGKEHEQTQASSPLPENATLEEKIWYELSMVYDPEIPVDIVNLGLIYDVSVVPLENGLNHVAIKMTLTAPGCGMGPHIMEEARMRVEALDEVEVAEVEMVWDPPWNQDMVSEEGRMRLGLI